MKSHGIDLDGTLAFYGEGQKFKPGVIGDPIEKMVERVKKWVKDGDRVDIFTARAHPCHGPEATESEINAVKEWCKKHLGFEPIVTCMKDPRWEDYWDDKAVRVTDNKGEVDEGGDAVDPLEAADGIGEFLV